MSPRFETDFDPAHGELVDVSPLLRRIVCDNPSKFTFHGTGTYVIGHGEVAVVDPGPRDDRHVANLLSSLQLTRQPSPCDRKRAASSLIAVATTTASSSVRLQGSR